MVPKEGLGRAYRMELCAEFHKDQKAGALSSIPLLLPLLREISMRSLLVVPQIFMETRLNVADAVHNPRKLIGVR